MKRILITSSLFIAIFSNYYSQNPQRIPMIEAFSSSTCGPCNSGNVTTSNVLANFPGQYTLLKYQMNWPGSGDPYYTSEAGSRKSYYGVNSVPRLQIDGQFDGNPSTFTTQVFNQYANIPSYTAISANYTISGQTVDININVDPHENQTDLKLFTAIFEYNTYNNVATNGETQFYNIMKKLLPGGFQGGQYIASIDSGIQQNFSYSYTFNGSYILPANALNQVIHLINHTVEDFNNLGVAVWLQDNNTKKILQSTTASLVTNINQPDSKKTQLMLFPNPARYNATIYLKENKEIKFDVTITNILGEIIMKDIYHHNGLSSSYQIDLNYLNNGLYNVSLQSENLNLNKKLQVIK